VLLSYVLCYNNALTTGERMNNAIELTEYQIEQVALNLLKRDLENQLVCEQPNKKLIKMLKRAINFYSVSPPYDNV
jgi:hypothetical protein